MVDPYIVVDPVLPLLGLVAGIGIIIIIAYIVISTLRGRKNKRV